jgi:hypothetical protein
MAVDKWRSWNACAIITVRLFLATTLLLGAFVSVLQPTFYTELLFSLELILGAAIAVGWLIRYAAALVLLATVVDVLTPYFHLALLAPNTGTTVAVLIASGILVCFGQNPSNIDAASIDENNKSSNKHSCAHPHDPWYEHFEVTIRLENCLIRSLRRHRCIVTIRDRVGGVQKTGQEEYVPEDDR